MESLLSVLLGLGLSAACGFRIFVPLLIVSVASRSGHLTLAPSFQWIATDAAMVAFAVATVLEIGAYYVPWLDNLLDTAAGPAAVTAGVIVSASVITDLDPLLKWSLALIAGGGLAGGIQLLTSGTRLISTATTGGLGNPIVATAEAAGSITLSLLSILLPLAALAALVALAALIAGRLLAARPRART